MNILIRCFGCTANFGEATSHMNTLKAAGHTIVNSAASADIAVVQTCCVIERTELNMLREITALTELSIPLIVSGCMATSLAEKVSGRFPDVVFLRFGEEKNLPELVRAIEERISPAPISTREILSPAGSHMDTLLKSNIISPEAENLSTTHIEVVSNGCLGNCSYCITRIARGPLRSFPSEVIRKNISKALAWGKREIFLTSQDNAVYGFDRFPPGGAEKNGAYYLPQLLRDILSDNESIDFRLRVGMMNPWGLKHIIRDLLPIMKDWRVYSFIHLPVQSGDDPILGAMKRRYVVSDFEILVKRFREEIPDMTLSTDVIVGFPGESEEQFRKTVELMELLRPDVINITRFSGRAGTTAIMMKGKVPGWKAKNRSREMTKLRFGITSGKLVERRGEEARVLAVERGKNGSTLMRTDNYTTVVVLEELPLGSFYTLKITDSTDIYLVGEIVDDQG